MQFLSISDDVILGKNVKIFNFVNLYGCQIGDNTKIGAFVEIQKNAFIGCNCKISSHTFICEGVHIEDQCFIGHNVTFINDKFPKATTGDGKIKTGEDWKCIPTYVKKRCKYRQQCNYSLRNYYWRRSNDWGRSCCYKRCSSRCNCCRCSCKDC